jgi:membrane protein YqaA with SNARE-associated domain
VIQVELSLWALFASSFVSSTILPGNSEIVLVAVLKAGGATPVAAVLTATAGNTLGGLTTYLLGRLLPSRLPEGTALARVRRFGATALLFSWLPLVGDALCAAAGWLRLSWVRCLLAMAAGKLVRYALLAQAVALLP